MFHRRSGQQKERTTGGADSMSGGQRGVWREERTAAMVEAKKGQYVHLKGRFNKKGRF